MTSHVQQIRDDFTRARHHVEDRLSLGAPLDMTVREFFCEDQALMRDFVRDCRVDCLRESFRKNSGHAFSAPLLNFIDQIGRIQKLTRTASPYIVATPEIFGEIADNLRIARMMRENNYEPSAMLVEERISADIMPRLRHYEDRNRVRALMMAHEFGL